MERQGNGGDAATKFVKDESILPMPMFRMFVKQSYLNH
jgi:hypothetical protein